MFAVKTAWINPIQQVTISKDIEGRAAYRVDCVNCQNFWQGRCADGRNQRRPEIVSDCLPVMQARRLMQEVAR